MITQRQFSEVHVSFWELMCPSMQRLVRAVNLAGRDVFDSPMNISFDTSRTFLINEIAFELSNNIEFSKKETISELMDKVKSQFSIEKNISDIIPDMINEEIQEAMLLSKRIAQGVPPYVRGDTLGHYRPNFSGIGILSDCSGDIRYNDVLVEIKSGERNLRTSDFRQVITYYVLSVLSEEKPLSKCLILNARQGYRFFFEFSELIEAASGMPLVEFTAAFRDYLVDWKMCD